MPDLERGLRYFIIFGIFSVVLLTPFIFSGSLFFPYVVGKALFFRILTTLIFGAWILLAILDRRYLPSFNWVTIIFALFMVWVFIANLFGFLPSSSFWSNFERMEGYINLLTVFAFFVVSATVIDSQRLWFRLFNASLVAAMVMAMIALAQYADGANRADGLLGNPIYLAGYMLFHVFVALFFTLRSVNKNIYISAVYASMTVFFASLIFVTGTRGAMLGLVTGLFIATFLVVVRRGEKKWIRYAGLGGLVVAMLMGGLFSLVVFTNNYEPAKDMVWAQSFKESVKDLPAVNRFSRITFSEGDAKARFLLWGIATEGMKENPVLGLGQENFIHLFNSKYRPELFEREMWFDRAHNIFLEWGVAGGIPAMALYIAIFLSAIMMLWRAKELDYYIKAVFSALLVAHAVQCFFVFENIASHVLFITFIAFVVAVTTADKDRSNSSRELLLHPGVFKWAVIPFVVIITSVFTYNVHIKALQANLSVIEGMLAIECGLQTTRLPWGESTMQSAQQFQGGKCARFLPEEIGSRYSRGGEYSGEEIMAHMFTLSGEAFEKAGDKSPIGRQEAAELFSLQILRVLNSNVGNETKNSLLNRVELALMDLNQGEPKKTRPLLFLGRLYFNIGANEKAVQILELALSTAPERQHVLILLGQIYNRLGEDEKALEVLKKSHELETSFKEPRMRYAAMLLYLGEEEEYERVIEPLSEEDIIFEDLLLEPFMERREYDRVIEIREKRIATLIDKFEQDPERPNDNDLENIWMEYQRLVQTYRNIDDLTKAIEVAERAGDQFPQLENAVQNLIESIK